VTVQSNNAAQGGGIWSSGSANLAGCTLQYNNAENDAALDGGGGIWSTGSMTMAGCTVQYNVAQGYPAEGGGIWSSGALVLDACTVQSNNVQWYADAEGGGIWSSGSLTLEGGTTVQNNSAVGAQGRNASKLQGNLVVPPGNGNNGLGGGLYVAGGTVNLTDVTLSSNVAQGGRGGSGYYYSLPGGDGGNGLGGGLFVARGTVILVRTIVANNAAQGGAGGTGAHRQGKGGTDGHPGLGYGGGLYIDALAVVSLDAFTQANVKNNTASTNHPNIYGKYTNS